MAKTYVKQSYTRSYPQYAQKKSTSVVREKSCQVRKFVLGFVIKSQKKRKRGELCRQMTFLDKTKTETGFASKCLKTR